MGLPAHRLLVGMGGGGGVKLVSEQSLRKLMLLSPVVFLYTIANHTFSNSKYIHFKCFKVLNS